MATENNNPFQHALLSLIEAQAGLAAAQATLTANQARLVDDMSVIRKDFEQIKAILAYHQQLLEALPARVKQEIGFQR